MEATTAQKKRKIDLEVKDVALERLRLLCPPGKIIYTKINHVSRSGMMRYISVYVAHADSPQFSRGIPHNNAHIEDITFNVARVCGYRLHEQDGIKVAGCGFDAGFDVVYNLSSVLYGKNWTCIGKGCPSNDHSNGDNDYTPHTHEPAGYTFRHRRL